MKRMFRVMLGLALLLWAVTLPLFALSFVTIHESSDSNPLRIYVASDLSSQIWYEEQTYQVYPPSSTNYADSGFFVSFPDAGIVYGPDFGNHPGGSSVTVYPNDTWALVGQSLEGDGTSGNPWMATTEVQSPGGEVDVVQTVTYQNGQDDAEWQWVVNNISPDDFNCQFTHAAAIHMPADATCSGCYDYATGALVGRNQANNWYERLTPDPISDAYELNDYGTIWANIIGDPDPGTGQGLQNYINPDYIQQAAALQWNTEPLHSGEQITIKDTWRFGSDPPSCSTPPPPPPPTPPPVPPATPGVVITLNSTTLTAGDQLTVDVTVQPVDQRFDAYAVIIGGGAKYSMVLNKPGQVRGGLHPLITGMKKLTSQFSGHLLNIQIPSGVTGSYNVIVGLVPSGQKPSVRNVIPGYLDQKTVTIQ
jgi:hypothetical protein